MYGDDLTQARVLEPSESMSKIREGWYWTLAGLQNVKH